MNIKQLITIFIAAVLTGCAAVRQSQSPDECERYGLGAMPTDNRGRVSFSYVIDAHGSAESLYNAVLNAALDLYNNPKESLQQQDAKSHTIAIRGSSKMLSTADGNTYVKYSARIRCRDNRFRIDVYNLSTETYSSLLKREISSPAEQFTDANSRCFDRQGCCKTTNDGLHRRHIINAAEQLADYMEQAVSDILNESGTW